MSFDGVFGFLSAALLSIFIAKISSLETWYIWRRFCTASVRFVRNRRKMKSSDGRSWGEIDGKAELHEFDRSDIRSCTLNALHGEMSKR